MKTITEPSHDLQAHIPRDVVVLHKVTFCMPQLLANLSNVFAKLTLSAASTDVNFSLLGKVTR